MVDESMFLIGGGAAALVVTAVVIGKSVFGRKAPTTPSEAKVKGLVAASSMETSREVRDPPPKAPSTRLEAPASAPVVSSPKPAPLPPPTPKSQSIRPEIPSTPPAPSAATSSAPRPASVPPSSPPPVSAPNSRHTADELRAMIAGREADLSNIEVFYRLGVALQTSEAWDDAMRSLATVEAVSPGYRDAQSRLEQIVRATGGTPSLSPSQQTDKPPPMRAQQRTMMGVAPSVVLGPSPPREIPSPPPPPTKSDS